MSSVAVDYQHLKVQAADDLEVMREVLQLFLVHSEQLLDELDRTTDEKQWKQLIHTIKGSARGIGAFDVAQAAAHAEHFVLDNSKVESLKQAFEAARTFINENPM